MDALISEMLRWWVVVSMALCLFATPLIMIERFADLGTRLLEIGTASLVTLCFLIAAIGMLGVML